ncbi:hypothetical protein CE143_24705 [Photorhabdus luminescens]|uniref:O-antigen flippase n=1 Tax=Photorhabdus akhurstii TaxID=171438 RepID=A0ABX8M330_9GAMM|nr:hypothetical protein [Photorhabdus akhurstii]QXF36023.1 hypothetical protein B0X70_24665 [Photorhabdus akhurstii]UJD77863.1 hypothetical protein CE143_24705 [Photorhabdus luminescens]
MLIFIFLKRFLYKISSFSGIDFHVGVTLTLRLWSITAGGLLLILTPIYLSSDEQGYYFTFSSIIATQVFFELGFNYVVVQMVGHEMAGLSYNIHSGLKGDVRSIERIVSLIKLLKKWYAVISVLFFFIISSSGYYFFDTHGKLSSRDWATAWFILVSCSSLNLFISPFLSVLEGMGLVGQVAAIRLVQSVIGHSGLFFLLWNGYGLIAIPILSGSMAVISCWLIYRHRHIFFTNSFSQKHAKISWKKEIFPFQWRIALSWLSGYFIFQLFNPVIFVSQGEIEAGRIGLTLTIFTTMLSLSISWVTTKTPEMARLIAEGHRGKLNKLFKNASIKSGVANLLIILLFLCIILILKAYNTPFIHRIANFEILLMLFIISIFNHFIFCAATYMRAHKQEPMVWNSLITSIINVLLMFLFAKISSTAVIASYAFVIIAISFPWTLITFLRFIKRNR